MVAHEREGLGHSGAGDVQKAIDSGAPVVYLPNGSYEVDKTIAIKGTTKKLVGFQSSLKAKKGVTPLLRIEGNASIIFEHLYFEGDVEHAGSGTAVFRHADFAGEAVYRATGAGKTFIEDVIGRWSIGKGHRLWARQTNAEFGDRVLMENNGGTAWILGYKTEADAGTISLKQVGGSTEVLGALIYPLHDVRGDVPCWQVEGGGRFSASWVYNSKRYYVHVRHEGKDLTGNWGRGPALWSTEAGPK